MINPVLLPAIINDCKVVFICAYHRLNSISYNFYILDDIHVYEFIESLSVTELNGIF